MTAPTKEERAALIALAGALAGEAAHGPWMASGESVYDRSGSQIVKVLSWSARRDVARFIAAADPKAVTRLIDALDEAEAKIAEQERAVRIAQTLAQLGHERLRDSNGQCPFCDATNAAPDHAEGCVIGAAMALYPEAP